MFMSALISNLKTQVAYTFNSSLLSKLHMCLLGVLKTTILNQMYIHKDVLSLAKRPSFILVNTVISFAMRFF